MKLLLFIFSLCASSAQAASGDGVVSIAQSVTDAIRLAGAEKIMPLAIMWMGAFMALQFVITNIGLLKGGADLEAVWAKFLGSLFWFMFCFYLLKNGPDFIDAVGGGILNKFAGFPQPGWIITATLTLCIPFLAAISIIGLGNTAIALFILTCMLTVLAVGMMLAIKIMMLTIELGLIVMLSPLSFSLLGMNALKEQGIAPLKSLLSLIYRIILLSVICVAFTELLSVSSSNLKSIGGLIEISNPLNWPSIVNTILSTIIAFPVIGYLVFKSDSIAASLAGGSSNMGTGDVASAAAMGAAAGAAIASGGAAVAATNPVQSMADVIKSMGGGGSVSNAGGSGAGGASSLFSSPSPMSSMSEGSPKAAAPQFEFNKAGFPMNPDPNEKIAGPSDSDFHRGGGSGSSAGVSGISPSRLEENVGKLVDQFASQQSGNKKSFTDHLSNANQQISSERSTTSVSVNTHNSD